MFLLAAQSVLSSQCRHFWMKRTHRSQTTDWLSKNTQRDFDLVMMTTEVLGRGDLPAAARHWWSALGSFHPGGEQKRKEHKQQVDEEVETLNYVKSSQNLSPLRLLSLFFYLLQALVTGSCIFSFFGGGELTGSWSNCYSEDPKKMETNADWQTEKRKMTATPSSCFTSLNSIVKASLFISFFLHTFISFQFWWLFLFFQVL